MQTMTRTMISSCFPFAQQHYQICRYGIDYHLSIYWSHAFTIFGQLLLLLCVDVQLKGSSMSPCGGLLISVINRFTPFELFRMPRFLLQLIIYYLFVYTYACVFRISHQTQFNMKYGSAATTFKPILFLDATLQMFMLIFSSLFSLLLPASLFCLFFFFSSVCDTLKIPLEC